MRRPGDTDLDIWIHYPGEGDADERALNRMANWLAAGLALFFLILIGGIIAGAW